MKKAEEEQKQKETVEDQKQPVTVPAQTGMSSIPEEPKETKVNSQRNPQNIDLTINCNIDKGQQTRTEDASLENEVPKALNETANQISMLSEDSPLNPKKRTTTLVMKEGNQKTVDSKEEVVNTHGICNG